MNGNLATALLLVLVMENPVLAFDTATYKVPDSAFSIPSGAIFVAPNGNDANAGTQAAPLLTPATAVKKAASGSTIVFRAGVYYEVNLGTVSKKITMQAYPHEQVHFLGSKPATGWTKEQTYWRTAWTNPLASQTSTCPKEAVDPAYPNACLPEQVFVAGAPLAQVTSIAEVVAGKFFMDSANKVLYIGTDPTSKLVEVGTLTRGLQFAPGAEGSRVLGIGIAHYSTSWGDVSAALESFSPDVTIDLCSFVQNAARALNVFRENQVVRSSVFSYNGQNGIGCNKCHGSLFEWNYISFNNQENFATSKCGAYCTTAGMKVSHVDRLTVNMNNFDRNNAGGLWFDLGCTNAMVTRNLFKENGLGVGVEVSSTATIASNAFVKQTGSGISISGSDRTRVYNNNFVKNQVGITIQDDTRKACEFENYSCNLNLTWDTTDTVVRNNLFSNNFLYGIDSNQVTDQVTSSNKMFSAIDHNGWYRTDSTGAYVVRWCPTSTCTRYKTHTNFMQATNLDWAPPSIGVRDTPNNPFFVDENSDKLSLKSDSSARSAGTALPADIAAYLGVKASPIDMGEGDLIVGKSGKVEALEPQNLASPTLPRLKLCQSAQQTLQNELSYVWNIVKPNVNAQQSFATLPCANMPGTSTLYMDPSVLLPGNRQTINAPIATCPTCLNQFYYAPNPSGRPNNGMGLATQAQQDNPSVGFAEKIVCPNWCACSTTQCVQNINTNLYLYPVCNAASGVARTRFRGGAGKGSGPNGQNLPTSSNTMCGPFSFFDLPNFVPRACAQKARSLATPLVVALAFCAGRHVLGSNPPALCFAGDTMVRVINETKPRRMDQLKRGDWVLAVSMDNNEPAFSRIDWWIHRSPTTVAEFRRLELENGVVLKLTAKHFIYRRTNCSSFSTLASEPIANGIFEQKPVFADTVLVGDCVFYLTTGKAKFVQMRVRKVSTITEQGIYAPMTSEGNIVVEGVIASCFALLDSRTWHQSYYDLMTLSPWIGWLLGADLESDKEVTLPFGFYSAMELVKSWYGSDG
ncbi:hint module domain-containing protein [Ditylenchus destructor]|nr:hint module domain-containing protein [Ditylenchus destructor]